MENLYIRVWGEGSNLGEHWENSLQGGGRTGTGKFPERYRCQAVWGQSLQCWEGEGNNPSSGATFGDLLLTIAMQESTPATSILTHLPAQARCGAPGSSRKGLASNHAPFPQALLQLRPLSHRISGQLQELAFL